jgi:hypothetical protein
MNVNQTFNTYKPRFIKPSSPGFDLLTNPLETTNLLICGEIHGVVENADIMYSLFHHFDFTTLALERTQEEAGAFIDSLKPNNNVDFSLIDKGVFIASVLSPQFAKVINVLFTEGKLKKVEYIDTDEEDREAGIAKNILTLSHNQKTLCVLGNWHTTIEVDGHKSALEFVRDKLPNIPLLEYEYCYGQYYNVANGLDEFEDKSKKCQEYKISTNSANNFKLFIPKATPITS